MVGLGGYRTTYVVYYPKIVNFKELYMVELKKISVAEFEKRVEMEIDYLVYESRGAMNKKTAREEAIKTVSEKYQKE